MNIYLLIYPVIGIFAGLVSGVLGIGGGLVVVPLLAFVFALSGMPHSMIMHMAMGTSLAVMIATSTSSVTAHSRQGNVLWPVMLRLLPTILIGVVLGATCVSFLSTRILEILFGLFVLFISFRMLLLIKSKPHRTLPGWFGFSSVGLFIGFKSGLLGVGGGAITIPFLNYCNVPMRKASGTSVACTLPIAIVGSVSYMIAGWHFQGVTYSSGYIYWPAFFAVAFFSVIFAPIGVKIGARVNTNILKRLFGVFLLAVSLKLLL